MFGQPGFEGVQAGGDGDAEGLLQPGQETGLQQVEGGREPQTQLGELALKQGQSNQNQAKYCYSRQHDHCNGSRSARPAACFQPVDQRVEHVGQQGAGQEGREDGAEQVDQSARDEQGGEGKPGEVAWEG